MLGLTIPRKYGGLELSSAAYARVFETLSTVDAGVAVLVGVHCGLGAKAIVLHGNDEQKERYLPALARGDFLAAYALTEPDVGSDAQNIKTTATLTKDGSHWRLNGRKIWIGNAHRAGVIATFAQAAVKRRGEDVQRVTAFLIRPDMPGFRVVGTVHKLGIRGSTQAELAYEQLEVPADHLLGAVGRGFGVAVHVLNAGRLTLAAGCTGATKATVKRMTTYAEERAQFGHPLADFEITLRKLGMLGGYATSRVRLRLGQTSTLDFDVHDRLKKNKEYFEKHVAELGAGTDRVIIRHREKIVETQFVLERLANMAIDLFATAAVIARTQSLIDERGVEMCDREIALADLFCVEAGGRVRTNPGMLASREEEV